MKRYALHAVALVAGLAVIAANVAFVASTGRLPVSAFDLLNWIFGL